MNRIITIGRQNGSGGAEIGRLIAAKMGVPFYDKERLKEFAVENGLGKAIMDSYGERHATSLLFALSTSAYSFGYYDASQDSAISQKAYLTAFETIRVVAKQGPCVIVGRCADYVLRKNPGSFHVFIHAPIRARASAVSARMGIDTDSAEEEIREQDRLRQNYYNYYTTKSWGQVESYHLAVDGSILPLADTAEMILQYAKKFWSREEEGKPPMAVSQ